MGTLPPRAVVVTRPTDYEALLLRHGTREQARFFLATRQQKLEPVIERHEIARAALHRVLADIPLSWRRAQVARADLDRFLFEPEDLVIVVGQDGLVANVAKYLAGQCVVGINPSPALFPGVLVHHPPEAAGDLMSAFARGTLRIEPRAMVEGRASDGSTLVALNELFLGHERHQSARYTLTFGGAVERQSSSGLVVATGTGASGWARSVSLRRQGCPPLPAPTSNELVFLVREAWPSSTTGAEIVHGTLSSGEELVVASEMNEGGVCFGDGIEGDRLELPYGQIIHLRLAKMALALA